MQHKMSISHKLDSKKDQILRRFGKDATLVLSSSDRRKTYSDEEIDKIIYLKQKGATYQSIADSLGRTYWSVVYKVSELKKQGLL